MPPRKNSSTPLRHSPAPLSGWLYKKGSGLIRRGVLGRTNWKRRYFTLSVNEKNGTGLLKYYDQEVTKGKKGKEPVAIDTMVICPETTLSAVLNGSHADKFCFQVTLNSKGSYNRVRVLEGKFSEEEVAEYQALFMKVDEDGSGAVGVEEMKTLLTELGGTVPSDEKLQVSERAVGRTEEGGTPFLNVHSP